MRDVWVDTDMGFDDLAAIAMVNDRVAALSIVAGNMPLEEATLTACAFRDIYGCGRAIHAGAGAALNGTQVVPDHLGDTGMPDVADLPTPAAGPDSHDAIRALAEWLDGGGRLVLALGPLTNIARLLQLRPDLARRMQVTWLGGSATGGNQTAHAEFNAAVDPEALDVVLRSGAELAIVGLDCCEQVAVTAETVAPLRIVQGDKATMLLGLVMAYIGVAGGAPMPIYDPVAAAALLDPTSVAFRPARVSVDLGAGPTRGRTVVDWLGAPNALMATQAASARIRGLFLDGLLRAAGA